MSADRLETIHLLRNLTGVPNVVLAGRAGAAIEAALRAWGLRDRAVWIPANICYVVLWALLRSGNHPVLVDVDPVTAMLTPQTLDAQLTASQSPAAVIPCHLYGLPAPMEAIGEWARAHDVWVIEDAALALGAVVDGRPAGAWGDAAVFSFGQGKIVDHGVGGALVSADPAFAREVNRLLAAAPPWDDDRLRRTNEWHGLYWTLHQYEDRNPRLPSLYPALFDLYGDLMFYRLPEGEWRGLPEKLRDLPANLAHRARLAAVYDEALAIGSPDSPYHTLPRPAGSILWRYPLLVPPDTRDDLLAHLWESGLHDVTRWYPALGTMAAALAPSVAQSPTPAAASIASAIINLPVDPGTDEAYARRAAGLIRRSGG